MGAGATQKARWGKLVATSPKTGRLPSDIIAKAPDANRLDGLDLKRLLPVSKTEDLGYLGEVTAGKVVHKLTLSLPGPGTLVASGTAHLHISRETRPPMARSGSPPVRKRGGTHTAVARC